MRTLLAPIVLTVAVVVFSGCALARTSSEPSPTEGTGGPVYSLSVPGETGPDMAVDIFDDTHSVRGARPATKPDIVAAMETMTVEGIAALPVADDPRSVFVAWVGLTCDEHAIVTISPGISGIAVSRQLREPCDPVPNGRGVVLSFGAAVDPSRIDLDLQPPAPSTAGPGMPGTSPSPAAPSATPYAPPSPVCPAPAQAIKPPTVRASIGDGPQIDATLSSSVVSTCSTTGTTDGVANPGSRFWPARWIASD